MHPAAASTGYSLPQHQRIKHMKQTLRETKMHRQTTQPQPHALTQLVEANTQQQSTVHTAMHKHNGSCDSDNPLIGRLFYHVTYTLADPSRCAVSCAASCCSRPVCCVLHETSGIACRIVDDTCRLFRSYNFIC